MNEYLDFAKLLALECGKIIHKAYNLPSISYESKQSATDLVSVTDREVEENTKQLIFSKYPDHKFIAEESVSSGSPCKLTSAPTWILDPIDGTTNFINRFPYCCYSLGFYVDEQAQVAVVFNPIMNDLYWATRGGGAFHNNKSIHVSQNSELLNSVVCSDWGNDRVLDLLDLKTENMRNVVLHSRGLRSMGSAALHMCFVASGSCDVFFEYGIHCWDIAAARLIVEEAGGTCTMIDGSPLELMKRQILACGNSKLIPQIGRLLKPVPYPFDE